MSDEKRFRDGQRIHRLHFSGGGFYTAGNNGCASIEVVMENGEMAPVPWFLVTFDDGKRPQKWNGALVEGVDLEVES